jgi:hypothetical protein
LGSVQDACGEELLQQQMCTVGTLCVCCGQCLLLDAATAGNLGQLLLLLLLLLQGLSDGLTAYEQCRKLADTPFPFPW